MVSYKFLFPLFIASSALASLQVQAQQKLQASQSEIVFVSKQMGVPVEGRFKTFDAQISFDPAKPVAVFCAVGGRAGQAAQVLERLGYSVHNIGGFGDWVSAGGAVQR